MLDWHQTPQTVTVSIPLSYKIDVKKVDSVITEKYIKLNVPEMKIFKFIDLYQSVDMETSNVIIEDRKISFYLNKLKEENWPCLEFINDKNPAGKEELKERRKAAEEKLNEKIKMEREVAEKKRVEFDKFVVDKSIKIDEEKRKELREKKSSEKNEAERDLYQFVNEMDGKKDIKKELPMENIENNFNKSKVNPNLNKAEHLQEKEEIIDTRMEIKNGNTKIRENLNKNDIFDEKSLIERKENDPNLNNKQNISEPRQQTSIKVNLTEKLIPHFAARESLSKEPPYPKSKKYVPEKNMLGQEIEDRNPIWIKEKADNFFKNKDYRSAINAYNRSIELDPDFHKCYLNRATCLLLLGEFELALQDLQKVDDLLDRIDSKEKEDPFYNKIKIKTMIKSYAIHSILNNYSKSLEVIDNILNNKEILFILGDKTIEKIKKDREMIYIRMSSEEEKTLGDKMVEKKEYKTAKEIYNKILEKSAGHSKISMNEKILSNLSLIATNEKNHDLAVKYCTEVLRVVKNFKEKISLRNNKYDNSLEIKIILRRAESYVELGEMSKAQSDLETAEKFEIRNKAILAKFHYFKEKLKTAVLQNYEKAANEMLKKKQFSEALELYDKSLFLIKKKEKVEQFKFFLNRTTCLLALGQFENVCNECSRILGIILKQKNIATINSNLELLKQLSDLEFMAYVKRAFAYTKSAKLEEAVKDYQSALAINPNDANVKKNLVSLQNSGLI